MERNQQLESFIIWWQTHIKGDEKGEAQIFLDRFLKAFGHEGAIEAGGTYEKRVRREIEGKTNTAFADYVLNGTVLIEMKKRGENLATHYNQLEDYWKNLPKKPRYAILCNFDELWIYDLPVQFYNPVDRVAMTDLVTRQAALEFLFKGSNRTPVFQDNRVDITQKAAESLAMVFRSLTNRAGVSVERPVAQRYVLQCMLALFAEDIQLMPPATFTRVVEACLEKREDSYEFIGWLFTVMNDEGRHSGRFYDVPYFNGGIFSKIRSLSLNTIELQALHDATRENWAKIKPAIFGTIFEQSLSAKERHQIGAHYTSEQDIHRIVDPVIIQPWLTRIAQAKTPDALVALHTELCAYRVLDPACGSGNFLYIAYIELKKLERTLLDRLQAFDHAYQPTHLVSVKQFYGFDVNLFAVELAKVTLMIAKKIAVDELHSAEPALPLDNLDQNIRCEDALFADWGQPDAIIGNPPYITGTEKVREFGQTYVSRLEEAFPDIPGRADYCVYWFRKAHDVLQDSGRAGMVGTNTIRENNSRVGGLDYIVANNGHIFDAVSSQPWTGAAVVHVSIVNWSKGQALPIKPRLWLYDEKSTKDSKLTSIELDTINSSLSPLTDVKEAKVLTCNVQPKRAFEGQKPGHTEGFTLTIEETQKLLQADPKNAEVIYAYLIGDELLGKNKSIPSRYIIDFRERDIHEAKNFPQVFKRLQDKVYPKVTENAQHEGELNTIARLDSPKNRQQSGAKTALNRWWLHVRSRPEMAETLQPLKRCIVHSQVSKRGIFEFASTQFCLGNSLKIFAFDDDYTFGVLQSSLHWVWLTRKSSSLKGDTRNTTTTTYDTFPFPQTPAPKMVKAVAEAGRALHEYRRDLMTKNARLTLREMYRMLELAGKNPLKDLHSALDKAVMSAYGFQANDDVLQQLLTLNQTVAERIVKSESVTAPGIPSDYPHPQELVSEGCIIATLP